MHPLRAAWWGRVALTVTTVLGITGLWICLESLLPTVNRCYIHPHVPHTVTFRGLVS